MKKVLFVTSSLASDSVSLPVGVLRIATVLKRTNKHAVEIIDIDYLIKTGKLTYKKDIYSIIDEFSKYMIEKKPDVIGFSTMCNNYHVFLEICEKIKSLNPSIKIFLGGPQATLTAKVTMEKFEFIDLICKGESEEKIEAVIDYLVGDDVGVETIKGVVYRKESKIIDNAEYTLTDLNNLIPIDYDLIPFIDQVRVFSIEGGRGCPYSCIYCSTKTFFKRKYRLRPLEEIVDEMEFVYKKYGKQLFSIEHDLFTVDKERIIKFCDLLISRGLDVDWYCSARIDTIDRELALKLKEARCTGIFVGIETGSQKMQEIIKKRLNLNDVLERARMIYDVGIKDVTFSFIYGFENEQESDIKKTLDLINQLYQIGYTEISLNKITILAGTELFEKHKEELLYDGIKTYLNYDINRSNYKNIVKENPEIFPQYFITEKLTVNEYECLDAFISSLCKLSNKYFNKTFKLILQCFNFDLYQVYVHAKNVDKKIFRFIRRSKEPSNNLPRELNTILPNLKYYIKYGDFKHNNQLIKECFKLEMDKLLYSS